MSLPKYRINLTGNELNALERLIRQQTTPQNKVKRAKIIIMANEEAQTNQTISETLGVTIAGVIRYRNGGLIVHLIRLKHDLKICRVRGGQIN